MKTKALLHRKARQCSLVLAITLGATACDNGRKETSGTASSGNQVFVGSASAIAHHAPASVEGSVLPVLRSSFALNAISFMLT
ncbi:MAG: hypothetical protein QM784_27380 [Polyangiaceae bacterium]